MHYGGLAADMPAILDIARRHGLKVVEDAAHALPTTSGGRLVGTLDSDAAVSASTPTRPSPPAKAACSSRAMRRWPSGRSVMRLHGMSRDAFDRFTAAVPSWYYEIVAPGFKYNLTDIAAAIGLHQLAKAHRFAERRAAIAGRFNDALASLPVLTAPCPPAGELHAWHLYPLQVSAAAGATRDRVIERLFERGIGCSVHYIPLHQQPYWRDRYRLTPQMFPHSQRVYERQLSLPIYTRMTDADVERVIRAVEWAVGSPS